MVLSRVFAYILLFVIKCRFPSSKSFANIIRDRYDENTLQKTRKLEKLDFKIRKCELDIEYLKTCIENNLRPKFLNFKVANPSLKGSKAYRECQLKLLKQELANKKSEQRIKDKEPKITQTFSRRFTQVPTNYFANWVVDVQSGKISTYLHSTLHY